MGSGADSYRFMTGTGPDGRCYAVVSAFRLEVPPYWGLLTRREIAAADNGCGLGWWPKWVRRLLDLVSTFWPAARVHDVEWARAVCPRDIAASNWRFLRNCLSVSRQSLKHVTLALWVPQIAILTVLAAVWTAAVAVGGLGKKRHLRKGL